MPRRNDATLSAALAATDAQAGPLAWRTRHEPTAATAAASAPGNDPYTHRATAASAPAVKRHTASRSLPGQLFKATRPLSGALTLLPLLLLGAMACCASSAAAARALPSAAAGAAYPLLAVPTATGFLSLADVPSTSRTAATAAASTAAATVFGDRTKSFRQGWKLISF